MLVEALIAAVGVLAGLTTVAWNVMQMRMARRAQELDEEQQPDEAEWQAAVTIQRAYRLHRSTRMRYGAFEMEWSSEQLQTSPTGLPTGLPTSPTGLTTGRAADSDSDSEDSPQPRKGGYWFR
jgi:hypothetical protein